MEEKITGTLGCKLFGESPVNTHVLNRKALQLLIAVYCLTLCTRKEKVIGMYSLLLGGLYIQVANTQRGFLGSTSVNI